MVGAHVNAGRWWCAHTKEWQANACRWEGEGGGKVTNASAFLFRFCCDSVVIML